MYKTILKPNVRLYNGDYIPSAKRVFFAVVQSNGNFCMYMGWGPGPSDQNAKWCAVKTPQPEGRYFVVLQDDGDFALYRETPGDPPGQELVWSTGTGGGPVGADYYIMVHDQGPYIYLYEGAKIRWSNRTPQP